MAGTGQAAVTMELDGTELAATTTTAVDPNNYALSPWAATAAEIPAGPHTVRWRYTSPAESAGTAGWLLVDDFVLANLGLQDLAEALDLPTQLLETDLRLAWSVSTDDARVGATKVLGQLGAEPHATLSLPLTGPCVVSFQWQRSSYNLGVSLRTPRQHAFGITPSIGSYWQTVEEFIPPGQNVLQWVLTAGTPAPLPGDTFGLDGLSIATNLVNLNEALDDPSGNYTTAGNGVYPMASRLHEYDDDAVFLDNGSSTSGWVQRPVVGPATVHWKATSEASVWLDGVAKLGGSPLIVPGGTHEVRWSATPLTYSRLERVQVVSAISLGAALEDPTPGWSSSPEAMALDFHDPTNAWPSYFDTRVLIGATTPGVQGWVQKEIIGPAMVEWYVEWDRNNAPAPPVSFTVDGVVARTRYDPQRNYLMIVSIPPGPHVARWTTNAGAQVSLDRVRWQASPPRPWTEILVPPTGTLRAGGNQQWLQGGAFSDLRDAFGNYVVVDLVTHPTLLAGEQMWLEWVLEGPGVATFKEYYKDSLNSFQAPDAKAKTVWLDGGPVVAEKSGWPPVYNIQIPAGSHRIRWVVDGPVAGGGFLQLAELGWQPLLTSSFGTALGQAERSWFNSGSGWTTAPAALPGVGEAVAPPISYNTLSLSAEFTGPAVLEYRVGGVDVSSPGAQLTNLLVEQLKDYSTPLLPVDSSSGTGWLWQTNRMELPPGRCMVAFPSRYYTATAPLLLDTVTTAPLPTLLVAESLQMPPRRLQQGGVVPWVGYQKTSGKNWIAPADGLRPGEQCWLAMTITGPARIEFPNYRAFSYAAEVSVLLDGSPVKSLASPSVFGPLLFNWTFGAGEHEIRLLVKRRFEGIDEPRPTVELEVPRIVPLPFPSRLPGWNSFRLTTDPRSPWVVDPATVGSGPNGNGATFRNSQAAPTAWAELEVSGPKWIVFDWDKAAIPNIDLDRRKLVVAQYETMRTTIPVIRSGIFIPAGKHQLTWQGLGPLTFVSVTDPPPAPDLLPGDPITLGRPGEATFIENTSTGWSVDAASFVEGTTAWSAPRFVGAWMGFRGPGTLTYGMRNTGSLTGSLRVRIDADAASTTTSNTWMNNSISIPAGWHVVQFQSAALPSYSSWLDDVRFTATDEFGKWCQAHSLPLMDWFIDRDTNGDGIPNGVEYAFGLDPWTAKTSLGVPELPPSGLPQVRFPQPDPAATGVTTRIQVSSDLLHWSDAASVGLIPVATGACLVIPMPSPWTYARMKVQDL
jgi:hypothetical protein